MSLSGRFGTSVSDQFIDQTDTLGAQLPDELLYLGDGSIARSDPQLPIVHFHDNGIANLNSQFPPKTDRNDELAAIHDFC
ncbi:hypothetical protein ASF22_22425 [Methylobacterium sp. Leaf87]|nr:hypothetical protein ASF22_22425 [Methylobacterium sp. Leaf87]